MVERQAAARRRRSTLRRLVGLLGWVGPVGVLVLALGVALPTPWGAPRLEATIVSGPSMLPTYEPQDLLVTWRTGDYPVGTPIVYTIPEGEPGAGLRVVHRVVEVRGDGTHVMLGDNNDRIDPWLPRADDVRGEVVMRIPHGGRILRIAGSPLILAALAGALTTAALMQRRSDTPRRRKRRRDDHDGPADPAGPERTGLEPDELRPADPAPADDGDRGGPADDADRQEPAGAEKQTTSRMTRALAAGLALLGVVLAPTPAYAAGVSPLRSAKLFATTMPASLSGDPVSYTQVITSDEGSNYCARVTVTNNSAERVTWELTLDLTRPPFDASRITTSSGVTSVSFNSGAWRVRGAGSSATLAPGASTQFDYCADRPIRTWATATITREDRSEYCATVTVRTTSRQPITWEVTLDHATPGLTDSAYWLAAAPRNPTGATSVRFAAATGAWTVRGSSSNSTVSASRPATFTYCAPLGAAAPYVDVAPIVTSIDLGLVYCVSVRVSTTSTSWVRWQTQIDPNTPRLTDPAYRLTSRPWILWGATERSFDAATGTLVVVGTSDNAMIRAGQDATWSYCAAARSGVAGPAAEPADKPAPTPSSATTADPSHDPTAEPTTGAPTGPTGPTGPTTEPDAGVTTGPPGPTGPTGPTTEPDAGVTTGPIGPDAEPTDPITEPASRQSEPPPTPRSAPSALPAPRP